MTVITKSNFSEKKKNSFEPSQIPINGPEKQQLTDKVPSKDSESFTSVSIQDGFEESDFHRGNLISQTCLLLTGIIAMTMGFMGATHLYRQLEGQGRFRGICRIPYHRLLDTSSAMITGDFKTTLQQEKDDTAPINPWMYFNPLVKKIITEDSVELDFELDIETNVYESLVLPEISHGRYLHDFKVNKTAIIDPDGDRCFVMPLNREEIEPPRSLVDILNKMKHGTYKLDIKEIRKETRVILPPLTDLTDFGSFISDACKDMKTYRLEEATGTRFVRDAEIKRKSSSQFMEFAGKAMVHYNIVNIDEI